ncbi:MAG: NUDIX hydrolase [Myxococcota bacterium]|nr:NUDIX hydrolase [Myxococcota bacterium]
MNTPQWLIWARKLQAIAQAGLEYTDGPYDRERYIEISAIAAEIAAANTSARPEQLKRLFSQETGYATPKLDVRGVVFDEERVLLVQEASDGRWTLPGGWVDPGDTPRSAVEREIQEESGYDTKALEILDIIDRETDGHPTNAWSIWKVFIRCELMGGSARPSLETTDIGWFEVSDLPPLSRGRTLEHQLASFFARRLDPPRPARFN